jgi:hypothetical protein
MSGGENRAMLPWLICCRFMFENTLTTEGIITIIKFAFFFACKKSNVKKVPQPTTTSQRHAQFVVDFGIETP